MSNAPAFLARLGLDTTADERAIRRAYARLLKQIDQETEAARFQALREDYEQAIGWLAWRDEDDEDHDGGDDAGAGGDRQAPLQASLELVAQQALPESAPAQASAGSAAPLATDDPSGNVDPDTLADEVYQLFLSALPRLRHGRLLFDESLWAEHLRRCLADDRLFNIAASNGFEARIAYFLASERQPGHETLFNAAVNVFGWMADRQRLQQFHYAGAKVNRAIDERNMFDAQAMDERHAQKQVLGALRSGELPHPDDLRRLMPHLETMIARFPVLMDIIVDQNIVDHWRHVFSGMPVLAASGGAGTGREPTYSAESDSGSLPGFLWVMLIVIVGGIIRATTAPSTPPHYGTPAPIEAVTGTTLSLKPPGEQEYAPLLAQMNPIPRPAPPLPQRAKGEPLSRAQLDEISSRFKYKVEKDAALGLRSVEFEVHLDPNGKVSAVDFLRRSIDPYFDEAIEKAVRESKPFPASTARSFKLTYSIRITRVQRPRERVREPAPDDAGPAQAGSAAEAAPRAPDAQQGDESPPPQ